MGSRKNYNSTLIEILGAKPIAFNPLFAKLADSANAGLFLSQLLYWWEKGSSKGYIYKTIADFHEETWLTRSEQDRAIRRWKELKVIAVVNKGIPRRRHFSIDVEQLLILLESPKRLSSDSASQSAESNKLSCVGLQTITESTQKENTENLPTHLDKYKNNKIQVERNRLVRRLSMKRR